MSTESRLLTKLAAIDDADVAAFVAGGDDEAFVARLHNLIATLVDRRSLKTLPYEKRALVRVVEEKWVCRSLADLCDGDIFKAEGEEVIYVAEGRGFIDIHGIAGVKCHRR